MIALKFAWELIFLGRRILDAALLVLFFAGLSSTFLTERLHELVGLSFVAGVVAHNFLNRRFYASFLRGKFSALRVLNNVCVIFFAASVVVLAVSGLALFVSAAGLNWRAVHLGAAIGSTIALFVHLLIHVKRYSRGKVVYAAAAVAFVMATAGIFGLPYLDRWFHIVKINSTEITTGEKIPTNKKILTAYFSRANVTNFPAGVDAVSGASIMRDGDEIFGNAQMIALMASDAVGGDLFAIRTEKIYPADYSETTKIARAEFDSNELPALKELPNVGAYDAVILVYPLWWGTLPRPVENFLKSVDLRDKILIPIVTHGGGGTGNSLDALKTATNAKIIVAPLDIYSSDIPAARAEIASHLENVAR